MAQKIQKESENDSKRDQAKLSISFDRERGYSITRIERNDRISPYKKWKFLRVMTKRLVLNRCEWGYVLEGLMPESDEGYKF
jgi:hypothetical protein